MKSFWYAVVGHLGRVEQAGVAVVDHDPSAVDAPRPVAPLRKRPGQLEELLVQPGRIDVARIGERGDVDGARCHPARRGRPSGAGLAHRADPRPAAPGGSRGRSGCSRGGTVRRDGHRAYHGCHHGNATVGPTHRASPRATRPARSPRHGKARHSTCGPRGPAVARPIERRDRLRPPDLPRHRGFESAAAAPALLETEACTSRTSSRRTGPRSTRAIPVRPSGSRRALAWADADHVGPPTRRVQCVMFLQPTRRETRSTERN